MSCGVWERMSGRGEVSSWRVNPCRAARHCAPCEAHLRSAIVEVIVLEEVLDAEEGGWVVVVEVGRGRGRDGGRVREK